MPNQTELFRYISFQHTRNRIKRKDYLFENKLLYVNSKHKNEICKMLFFFVTFAWKVIEFIMIYLHLNIKPIRFLFVFKHIFISENIWRLAFNFIYPKLANLKCNALIEYFKILKKLLGRLIKRDWRKWERILFRAFFVWQYVPRNFLPAS